MSIIVYTAYIVGSVLILGSFGMSIWNIATAKKRLKESKQNLIDTMKICIKQEDQILTESMSREINLIEKYRRSMDPAIKVLLEDERRFQLKLISARKKNIKDLTILEKENTK